MKNNLRERLDFNSIRTTTMMYFFLLAIIIVLVIWFLQDIFIKSSYSKMIAQETIRSANSMEAQYIDNPGGFDEFVKQLSIDNGFYIRVDDLSGTRIYDGNSSLKITEAAIAKDLTNIYAKIHDEKLKSSTVIITDGLYDNNRIVYADLIIPDDSPGIFGAPWSINEAPIIYIIAPLYPLQSTINIIRTILFYISIMVLLLAMLIAAFLSIRLTTPLESITESAKQLSQGNYKVNFDGADFTETRELAKALNRASWEMEQAETYQSEIIANVSHDLKTPLTMIRSYAEKIIDISGDNPKKRNDDLNIIISETERLNTLVSDMMTLSSLQTNNIELNKTEFDIVKLTEEIYESFKILNTQGYNIKMQHCREAIVYADRERISQVIRNFISNAIKYSGDNKFVRIELKRSNRSVKIHIIDKGVGIEKSDIGHIWDRYYRTSANHAREIEGSGLGLSIVKNILSLHDAKYGVKSTIGQGSDFWFELDIVKFKSKSK